MARVRVVGRALGVARADEGDALGPIIPGTVQFNAEEGEVSTGDVVEIRVRVVVDAVVSPPLREG